MDTPNKEKPRRSFRYLSLLKRVVLVPVRIIWALLKAGLVIAIILSIIVSVMAFISIHDDKSRHKREAAKYHFLQSVSQGETYYYRIHHYYSNNLQEAAPNLSPLWRDTHGTRITTFANKQGYLLWDAYYKSRSGSTPAHTVIYSYKHFHGDPPLERGLSIFSVRSFTHAAKDDTKSERNFISRQKVWLQDHIPFLPKHHDPNSWGY